MSRRQTTLIVLPWVALIASGLVAIAVWHTQGGQASSNETRGHISPHTIRVIRNTSDTESLVQPKETADARSLVPGGRQQQKKLHAAEELQFVDQAGNPIDNANVFWLEAIATYDPSSYMLEPNAGQGPFAISDDRGVVTIPGDKQGELIAIFARDYVPHIARLEGPASIQLTSGKTLEVEVVNAEGSLLRDSRIFVEGLAWGWPNSPGSLQYYEAGSTDESGTLPLCPPTSRTEGIVFAPGYWPGRFSSGSPRDSSRLRIVLPMASPIFGEIKGANDSELYVAAEVEGQRPGLALATKAGPSGYFSFHGLTNDTDWLLTPCNLVAEDLRPVGNPVRVRPPMDYVVLPARESLTVRLRVSDATGKPLLPTLLSSLLPREVWAEGRNASILPDETLEWTGIRLPPTTRHVAWVTAAGYRPKSIEWSRSESQQLLELGHVVLESAEEWTVTVVSSIDDQPLPDSRVQLTPTLSTFAPGENVQPIDYQDTYTDPNGAVRLRVPLDGPAKLIVSREGWITTTFDIPSYAETNLPSVVRLQAQANLVVRCQSFGGDAVPGAALQWRSEGAEGWNHCFADFQGHVTLAVPPGDVEVRFDPGTLRAYASGVAVEVLIHGLESMEPRETSSVVVEGLLSGEERWVTLELPVMDGLEAIVTIDDMPASGIGVVAVPGSKLDLVLNDIWGSFELPKAVTDEQGRCTLDGVKAGLISLVAIDPRSDMLMFKRIYVEHEIESYVDMSFYTRSLVIKVMDGAGKPLPAVPLELVQSSSENGVRLPRIASLTPAGQSQVAEQLFRGLFGVTDAEGSCYFHGVPSQAHLMIRCRDAERFPTLPLVTVADAVSSVELREGSACALEIALSSPDGSPYVDTLVRAEQAGKSLTSRTALSRKDGTASFFGLPEGSWTVSIPAIGFTRDFVLRQGELQRQVVVQ